MKKKCRCAEEIIKMEECCSSSKEEKCCDSHKMKKHKFHRGCSLGRFVLLIAGAFMIADAVLMMLGEQAIFFQGLQDKFEFVVGLALIVVGGSEKNHHKCCC